MTDILGNKCDNRKKGFETLKEFDMHLYTLSWHGDIYILIYKHFALSDENDLREKSEDCQLPTRIATRVAQP
jgi:hypothetical protein